MQGVNMDKYHGWSFEQLVEERKFLQEELTWCDDDIAFFVEKALILLHEALRTSPAPVEKEEAWADSLSTRYRPFDEGWECSEHSDPARNTSRNRHHHSVATREGVRATRRALRAAEEAHAFSV